jgi:hypothetical protein
MIIAAEGRDFLMHARIGVMRALHRNIERAFNPDHKETHWGKRKLEEGSVSGIRQVGGSSHRQCIMRGHRARRARWTWGIWRLRNSASTSLRNCLISSMDHDAYISWAGLSSEALGIVPKTGICFNPKSI